MYMKLQTFSPTSLPSKTHTLQKSARLSYHPLNSKKHNHEHWNGWHPIPLSFSYTSHVNMLDWVNKCIEPPKILVSWMEWAFFVGDRERENIAVTMEWDGLHFGGGIRLIYRICESFRCRAFYVAWTQEYMDKKKTKKKELQNKERKKKK